VSEEIFKKESKPRRPTEDKKTRAVGGMLLRVETTARGQLETVLQLIRNAYDSDKPSATTDKKNANEMLMVRLQLATVHD